MLASDRENTVAHLCQPGAFSEDTLTEVLRLGARRLLGQAVEMEVRAFVEGHAELEQTQLNSALVSGLAAGMASRRPSISQ